MTDSELKECPFCGGKSYINKPENYDFYNAECGTCEAAMNGYTTREIE